MKFGIKNGKNYLYLVQHTLLWQQQSPVTSLDDSSSTEPKKLLDILNDRAAKEFYYKYSCKWKLRLQPNQIKSTPCLNRFHDKDKECEAVKSTKSERFLAYSMF